MQNKKFTKILALSLLGIMGLTACEKDEVVAKPSNYEDKIVDIANEEVFNNTMNIVLDGIREGSLASDVLNEVLYQYAVSVIGEYNSLKSAAASTDVDAFVKSHKAYWDENRAEGANASATEIARVTAKFNAIEKRIAQSLYNAISGGSYSKRNIFNEKDFLYSLRGSMNSVSDPNTVTDYYKGLLYTEVEDYEVFVGHGDKEGFLHREYYQSETNTYVADKIIPDIYRQLLVEQYLLDESYNTLGRSYARKVNVIAIANNSDYPKAAPYLMDYFVKNVVSSETTVTLDTFKQLSNAWKGIDLNDSEKTWIDACVTSGSFEKVEEAGEFKYYKGTKYGDMMEDYAKITAKTSDINYDSSIESDFTGSNTYTKEIGKEIKENNIRLEDYTTTGWYIKNGGLSSLPSAITNRLFNISVANAVNDKDALDRKDNGFKAVENESNYVAKINGKFYLKVASKEQGADDANDILFYDTDSSTYYIVQIEEAVSSSRLVKNSDDNYAALKNDQQAMEEIINEVAKIVADNDSYKTLSNKYWLEKAGLEYHDTVVYDYFKSNFPELFDDED